MRPAGDVRRALLDAAQQAPQGGWCLRELASRAQVGVDAARRTVDNLTRAGVLAKRGEARMPHRNRPVSLYGLPQVGREDATGLGLGAVMRVWH